MRVSYAFIGLFVLTLLLPIQTDARIVQRLGMKELTERSQLVFVGRVKSISPSGTTTELTYPTWEGVVFEWLQVDVEVIEPIKGTKQAQVVHTLILSTRGPNQMVNEPGMIEPKVGENLLLCLLPTTLPGFYASVTAPFDDREAIFPLEHKLYTRGTYYKDGKEVAFREQDERNRVIWDLTNDKGEINRKEVGNLRTQYKTEIVAQPVEGEIIHLKWKKVTNAHGWQTSVPNDGSAGVEKKNPKQGNGPITKP